MDFVIKDEVSGMFVVTAWEEGCHLGSRARAIEFELLEDAERCLAKISIPTLFISAE